MTSRVTFKGQTVVPKRLRDRFRITPGTTLDWQESGDGLRVVKLERQKSRGFLKGLRELARVPAARRDKRIVQVTNVE